MAKKKKVKKLLKVRPRRLPLATVGTPLGGRSILDPSNGMFEKDKEKKPRFIGGGGLI